VPKCKYCGEEYYDTHSCWTTYCMDYLKRNCEQCINKCKGYYNAQTTTTTTAPPSEVKREGKVEISESEKKAGKLEITESGKDDKNP